MNANFSCATYGTHHEKSVPPMAQSRGKVCHLPLFLAQNSKKVVCHVWHKILFVVAVNKKSMIYHNNMIIQSFQLCTHWCEVCEENNLPNNCLDSKNHKHVSINQTLNQSILKIDCLKI